MKISKQDTINYLIEISAAVATIKDLDILLEKILLQARKISNADAGSIYIINNNKLEFRITQNDTLSKRLETGKKLIYSIFSLEINNSTIAGFVANTGTTLNIDDVYKISENEPYTFGKIYDERAQYRTCSMLTIPLKTHIGKIVGVLQIINAKNKNHEVIPFDSNILPIMEYFANSAAIAIERAQMTREMILRMIKMAELRDPKETGAHVNRVAAYSVEIYETWALKNKLPFSEIEYNRDILRIAAMLHDVGKVGISDLILKKPASFTQDEYEIMKKHTILGARLFADKNSDVDIAACDIALNHHERWDGTGYPGYVDIFTDTPLKGCEHPADKNKALGKKGVDIPLFARIVAIADVYDALSCSRVYKQAWTEEKVLQTLRENAGSQFDPELIDCFFYSIDTIKSISERYKDNV